MYTFTFPPQQHKLGPGQDVVDPATGGNAGEIVELDGEARALVLKRGPTLEDVPLPTALIPGAVYRTNEQEDALERLGRSLLAGDRRYPAVESILRREPFGARRPARGPHAARALARGAAPRHPGAARLGEDVDSAG